MRGIWLGMGKPASQTIKRSPWPIAAMASLRGRFRIPFLFIRREADGTLLEVVAVEGLDDISSGQPRDHAKPSTCECTRAAGKLRSRSKVFRFSQCYRQCCVESVTCAGCICDLHRDSRNFHFAGLVQDK